MRLQTTLALLMISLFAKGQASPESKWVYTEVKYAESDGKGVVIQNSFPRGGGRYTHSNGKEFSYVIFWNRVINETTGPIELTINFPVDALAIFPSPDSYLKIFLPDATMTSDKVLIGDYGLTDLKSFLDANFDRQPKLHKTIEAKEECMFYIGMLFHHASGSARTELQLKGMEVFYNISVDSERALIPCGQIVLKSSLLFKN
jgi:hypothetical protein